jgi:hypothetical protein
MASFPVIEHPDVLEQIGPRLIPGPIAHTVHPLALE